MIVVVAGQTRNVGKTQAVCDIIAATREAGWIAVKITPHAHEAAPDSEHDTGRYLAAGAVEAHLIHGRPPVELPNGRNRIIESNAILDQLDPDLLFFLVDPENDEWKISALRHVGDSRAVRVTGRIGPDHIAMVRRILSEQPV